MYLNTRASLGSKCRGYSGLSERLQKATLTGKYFIYSLSTIKYKTSNSTYFEAKIWLITNYCINQIQHQYTGGGIKANEKFKRKFFYIYYIVVHVYCFSNMMI